MMTQPTIECSNGNRTSQDGASEPSTYFWLPVWTLTQRELTRFVRQRTRVVGALGQPLIFWILFGAGLQNSFLSPAWAPAGLTYQEYFFPGVVVLIVLFTAIFSTISIIEDRQQGFLQAVLVAPISPAALVFGKLCGGTVLALLQAAIFLVCGPLLHYVGLAPPMILHVGLSTGVAVLGFLIPLAFALTAVGYLIAWPLDSSQGFHAIMSVILIPLWLLSGACFPAADSGWIAWAIRLNPLTYGVAGLRRVLYHNLTSSDLPSLGTCLAVTCFFCVLAVTLAIWQTQHRTSKDTR